MSAAHMKRAVECTLHNRVRVRKNADVCCLLCFCCCLFIPTGDLVLVLLRTIGGEKRKATYESLG